MLSPEYADQLEAIGVAAGLDRVGRAHAGPFVEARRTLIERAEAGLAATMQFTYRNPQRSTDPAQTLPDVASLVVGARYYRHSPTSDGPPAAVRGRVAQYASADHYGALRAGLDAMARRLTADGWQARVVLDDNALVDRAAAHRAGIGWFGKNANILVPGLGSWVVLGSVLTDAPLPPTDAPVADGCGSCARCIDACPTGAIVAPGVVDARRCLAWLVQAEGVFPIEHRAALGDRLYGCDECQDVCPPSRPRPVERIPGRRPLAGTGDRVEALDDGPGDEVDVLAMLEVDDATLLSRFGRWYIPKREPRYLRRNALVVLGNSARAGDPQVRRVLALALGDADPIVRAHAVWAARRLDELDLLDELEGETDPMVRTELDRPAPQIAARVPVSIGRRDHRASPAPG